MLVLTNDTFIFTVPDGVARKCKTLLLAMETATEPTSEPPANAPTPLPNVTSNHMVRIVQFYSQLDALKQANASAEAVGQWTRAFFDATHRTDLYMFMESANYLGADEMLDAAAAYVARLITGKTPDQIREILMVPRDTTSEESRQAAEEFAWALK